MNDGLVMGVLGVFAMQYRICRDGLGLGMFICLGGWRGDVVWFLIDG